MFNSNTVFLPELHIESARNLQYSGWRGNAYEPFWLIQRSVMSLSRFSCW